MVLIQYTPAVRLVGRIVRVILDEMERQFTDCNCKIILTNAETLEKVVKSTKHLKALEVTLPYNIRFIYKQTLVYYHHR